MVPRRYPNHPKPAEHVSELVSLTGDVSQIGVFDYSEPDLADTSPFRGKIECVRGLNLDEIPIRRVQHLPQMRSKTQWAHLREGSSDPDAFFKYLKTAKRLDLTSLEELSPEFPNELQSAISELSKGRIEPIKYLSNSIGNEFHDRVWRHFWFGYILVNETLPIWRRGSNNSYLVNEKLSLIRLSDGSGYKKFFVGRSNSIKNRLVRALNSEAINEDEAWKAYAKNIHNRAHSYREDIDSGLTHLGLLEIDGKPSSLGYQFVDASERNGDPNSGAPRLILGKTILQNGRLRAFLHYVYKISEKKFAIDPMAFATIASSGSASFNQQRYLQWLEGILANNLQVMRKVSSRGGSPRRPFQAELAVLRNFGFVSNFRVGVGLVINWPKIQDALDYSI